jgi:peptidoglycan/LPS O-acetylase OafA/YrhL
MKNPDPPARYQSLDHWRGLAAVVVVLHHAALYSPYWLDGTWGAWSIGTYAVAAIARGWVGVPMFFAISGYCITAAAARPDTGTAEYFRRRFCRIYPPYWAALACALLLWLPLRGLWSTEPYSFPSPGDMSFVQWGGNLTLTETWLSNISDRKWTLLLGPAWTLCYEEQYYAAVGLLLAIFRGRLAVGFIALTVLFGVLHKSGVYVSHTLADPYWCAFAAGALVFFARQGRASIVAATALAAALALGVWRLPISFLAGRHSEPVSGAVVGMAFALVLLLLRPFDERVFGCHALAPLRWCGVRCFSIYLVHWPVCKTVGAALFAAGVRGDAEVMVTAVPASLALTLAAGHLFYVTIERRFIPGAVSRERYAVRPMAGIST